MSIFERRTRTVSFRLSEEEYDSLKNVSATRGARSVSEFTRSVACTNNGKANNGEGTIEDALHMLSDMMESLDRKIQMLREEIKEKNGTNSTDSNNSIEKEPLS